MKKHLTLFLAAILTLSLCAPVMAAESPTVTLELYCEEASLDDNEYHITVQPGDTIAVSYRQYASQTGVPITAAQDEIVYDSNFFEVVSDSKVSSDSYTTTEHMGHNYQRMVYFNTATTYTLGTDAVEIGTFTLRVKANASGETTVSSTDVMVLNRGVSYNTVAHDLRVSIGTAQTPQPQTFTVTLKNEDGTTYQTLSQTASGSITLPGGPAKEGYTFTGWTGNGTLYPSGSTLTITQDTLFTATYQVNDATSGGTGGTGGGGGGGGSASAGGGSSTVTTTPTDSTAAVTPSDDASTAAPERLEALQAVADCVQNDTCPTHDYQDLTATEWYHSGIHYCLEMGRMVGVNDDVFAPDGTLTRGMLVTILYQMDGTPTVTGSSSFLDVASGQWYANAITWAEQNNVVSGLSDTIFAPNEVITREQMAAILYRYAQYKGYDDTASGNLSGYTDAASISTWATTAIQWARGNGLMSGRTDTTIVPQGSTTRAEAATIIYNFDLNIV